MIHMHIKFEEQWVYSPFKMFNSDKRKHLLNMYQWVRTWSINVYQKLRSIINRKKQLLFTYIFTISSTLHFSRALSFGLSFHLVPLSSVQRTSLNVSYSTGLLLTTAVGFCLFVNVSLSPHFSFEGSIR